MASRSSKSTENSSRHKSSFELLIATRNKKKLKEIKELLSDLPIKITSLFDCPDCPEIIEDGRTFYDNAVKKAVTIAQHTGKLVMGEDSGLEVKALSNRPGVYSARFSGTGATDEKNNAKLLAELKDVPRSKRQARYHCFVALADQNGVIDVVDGKCSGIIAKDLRGTNGFGYDPLFLIPRYNKTFGELDSSIKAKISHRARALKKFRKLIEKYFVTLP